MKNNILKSVFISLILILGVGNAWALDFTNGTVVYFDNTLTNWSSIYLRVGHGTYNSASKLTQVNGTNALYTYTIPSWGGYEAFSFANSQGWTNNNSIYQPTSSVKPTGQYAITGQTEYFKWNLDKMRLFIPTSKSNTEQGCQYYNTSVEYNNYQRTVTITSPTNGSITVTYKDESNDSQSKTSDSFKVAQTCILTINATPNTGYQLNKLYIGDKEITSGSTYIVRSDVTISAEFVTANPQVVYLQPTGYWNEDNPRFVAHVWNNSSSEDIVMTPIGCASPADYYTCEIPAGYHSMLFFREKSDGSERWNKTADLTIPTNDNNSYTISSTGDGMNTGASGSWTTYTEPTYSLTLKHTPYGEYSVKCNNVTYTSSHSKDIVIDNLPIGTTFEITKSTSFSSDYTSDLIVNAEQNVYTPATLNTTYTICKHTTIQENFVTTAPHVVYLKVPKSIASSWNISGTSNFIYSYDNLNVLNSTVGSVIASSATSTDASFNTYTFTIPEGCHSFRFESKTGNNASASKYTDDFTHILPLTQTNCYTLKNIKDGDLFDGSWDLNIANGDYRILYIHQKVVKATQAGETWKTVIDTLYQHSSDLIKLRTTPGNDIVSLFIHRDATKHPEILLQQMKNGKWVDLEMRMVMGPLTAQANAAMLPGRKNTNGEIIIRYDDGIDLIKHDGDYPGRVYNFTVQQFKSPTTSADTARLLLSEPHLHPYTGNYYIRTDNAEGGWMNYTLPGNIMSHHEYPLEHSGYSHYFCKWVETTATPNTKFLVANDYGAAISDTITGDLFTDEHGTISTHANIRWMWNEYTNIGSRAYIAGSHEPNFLIAKYASNEPVKFTDKGDWVYEADLESVQIGDTLTNITAHYTSQDQELLEKTYQEEGLVMLTGDTVGGSTYTVRVIYDFKINRTLVYLIPNANDDVTTNIDVIIERTNQDEEGQATQVRSTISPANEEEGFTVYGLINLTKDHITDPYKSEQETLTYWISFPFDVKIGDIFGFGEVGKYWMIKYYDGAERAEKGWFLDTKTFWKFFMDTDSIMRANTGYVLTLNKSMLNPSCPVYDNTSTLQLYFPSLEKIKTNIHAEYTTTTCNIPAHKCTITSPADRTIKDSDWNLIGIPSYANKTEETTTMSVKYFYDYQFMTDQYEVAENAGPRTFYSMHAYMVQFGGTINWNRFIFTPEESQGLAAKRIPSAESESRKLRLELLQEGQRLDHTFIELQTEGATELFDMNSDLTKIFKKNASIYSIITHNGTPTELAANVLPLDSCVIPLGVQLTTDGEYTFAMPNGTDGFTVELLDYETNTATNLLLDSYTVALTAGTIEHRFALSLKPEKPASTVDVETLKTANGELRKYIIDGRLFLRKDGALYDAQGKLVR